MTSTLIVRNYITISAPPQKIWDILVNPAMTKQYMFGCEAISDWQEGSSLVWKGIWEGSEMIFVKGKIKTIHPPEELVYTTIDPNGKYEDKPQNYLEVTYNLASYNGRTVLTVSQGDYSGVPDGLIRYKEAIDHGGWQSLLEQIRGLAENNQTS